MSDNERVLVQQAAQQNTESFSQLYDRYVDKVYKYVYYKVGAIAEAEDLTAQVFLKAWEAIGSYRWTGRPFSAWLLRIAHNLVTDHFRTRHEAVSIEKMPSLADENGTDLETMAQSNLTAAALQHALTHLTDEQQQVIILKFLEGYSTEEVADFMDRDSGAVRALQHRALAALQRVVRKDV